MRDVNQAGVDLVKSFEGVEDGDPSTVNLDPYLDPVGIWTVGWGHAIRWNGRLLRGQFDRERAKALYPGGLTRAQAEALLRADLMDACRDVEACVKVAVTDNQFAALVSFEFNTGALRGSTLLALLNAGKPVEAAPQFLRWDKAGGKPSAGLARRRRAEMQLFTT